MLRLLFEGKNVSFFLFLPLVYQFPEPGAGPLAGCSSFLCSTTTTEDVDIEDIFINISEVKVKVKFSSINYYSLFKKFPWLNLIIP